MNNLNLIFVNLYNNLYLFYLGIKVSDVSNVF